MIGAALGLLVGVVFGVAAVAALRSSGVTRLVVPGGQLVVMVIVAAIAGMGAAIFPARRAARLDVLAAIATD
ncbi:MAG: hypothetical protein E6G17_13400 [Actinobacteria bacterium]|nr:MAG: hypothetical protein E6G17_13400 [Actinomycetota bacterium]